MDSQRKSLETTLFKDVEIAGKDFFSPAGSVGASEYLRYSKVATGDPHPSTRSACLGFETIYTNEKEKEPKIDSFSFWQGQKDLTVCGGFALHTYGSTTEILANFSTRLTALR